MAQRLRDPATGQEYIETDDGELIEAPQVGVELRPLGIGTGIDLPGPISAALIKAGGGLQGMKEGIFGAMNQVMPGTEMDRMERESFIQQRAREREQMLAPLSAEFPVSSFIGGAGPGASTMVLSGGPLIQGGIGAVQGVMENDPERGALERAITGGAFSLGGSSLGILGGKAISAITENGQQAIKTARQLAAKRLEDMGGFVTKGEKIGSDVVRQAELALARNPATSRVFLEGAEQNRQLLNRSAAQAIGLNPDVLPGGKITEEALAQADSNLSGVFNAVQDRVGTMDMGEGFGKKVLALDQFRKLRAMGDLQGLEKGIIGPREYSTIRQTLVSESQNAAARGEGALMERVNDLVDQLDDQAQGYLGKEGAADFAKAREQWRNLKVLQMSGVLNAGDVSPKVLANRLGNNYGTTFKQNQWQRLEPETAGLFKTVKALSDPNLRPIAGSSGTSETLMADSLWKSITRAARGDPGAIRDLGTEYGTGTLYNSLSPGALDVLFRESPGLFSRAGATAGRESDQRP